MERIKDIIMSHVATVDNNLWRDTRSLRSVDERKLETDSV